MAVMSPAAHFSRLMLLAGLVLGLVVGLTAPAHGAGEAAEKRGLETYVFGSWAYGDTDGLSFATGDEDGEYENFALALNLSRTLSDRLRVAGQLEFLSTDEDDEELEVQLDFLFASYQALGGTVRLGRIQHPFGIYSEVFDVGVLRPFIDLAPSMYGSVGVAGEAVDGIGYSVENAVGEWSLAYDLYFGRLKLEASEPWDLLGDDDDEGEGDDDDDEEGEEEESFIETKDRDDVIGGRLVVTAPDPRFRFGLSAFHGTNQDEELGESTGEELENFAVGAQVEFEGEKSLVRAEIYHLDEEDEVEADGFYIELGRFVSERWQLVARWDQVETEILEFELDDDFDSLTEHEGLALGVNWWITPTAVVKFAVHQLDGNRFALPEEFAEVLEEAIEEAEESAFDDDEGELDELPFDDETTLVEVGLQFSF
ncbi:MAG: hypothetical protein AAGC60_15925 [Acidobacteriota bacterium]